MKKVVPIIFSPNIFRPFLRSVFHTRTYLNISVDKLTDLHSNNIRSLIETPNYDPKVYELFKNPPNVGSLDKTNPDVGTGIVGKPACGDTMQLQIKVDPSSKIITDSKFKTFGCLAAISSASLVTEFVKGKHIDELSSIHGVNKQIAESLNLPQIKLHCSLLAEESIRAALNNYLNKQSGSKESEYKTDLPGPNHTKCEK